MVVVQENVDGSKKNIGPKPPMTPSKQHKRSPSFQKTMPVRPLQTAEKKPGQPKQQQKQDAKRVALFGHLYGQTRNTTIIGAGKDIHPAVLALGLQMSSYAVCGSSARCVAMLLAFKRVRLLS
jgi:translation initiation factor eIF-2B subunit delta